MSATVTHTFAAAGCAPSTNYIVLAITNVSGSSFYTNLTPIVVYPAPPTPTFTIVNPNVLTNVTVTFNNLTTGCTSGATWSWSFGDTTTASGLNATHAYTNANTYSVTLTVTSAYGFVATSSPQTVTVSSAPSVIYPTTVSIWKIEKSGNDIKLYGSNQPVTANAPFNVLWTNNVATARSNWLPATVTGDTAFNGLDGRFTNTIPGAAANGSKGFYTIQVPQP
jgi:PKD repeat protein